MSNTFAKNLHLCFRPQHHMSSPKHDLNHRDHHHHQHQRPLLPENTTYTKTYNSLYEDISCFPLVTTISAPSVSVSDTDTDMTEVAGDNYDNPVTPDLTAAYASRRFFISSPGQSNSIVDSLPSSSTSSPDEEADPPPAATVAYASRRFFISSPGRSNSIVDSLPSSPDEEAGPPPAVAGGVAVETYSPDPYTDFRRSMEEMVEAREVARGDVKGAWEYLQELLLSYLSLNPKNTHKYIVRAFADVVANNMSHVNNNVVTSTSSSQSFSSYFAPHCNHLNNNSYV
ncbi:hypothetical protein RND81_02G013200 [Saponaria officinalis]|uniref:Transcription repressor n=1 Tax=Saponaria officinalis TaxID=3572 RepID=A0AAW1MRA2_SAPOF